MILSASLQKLLDKAMPKAEQGPFVEAAVRKALAGRAQTKKSTRSVLELFVDGGSRGNPGPSGGGYVAFRDRKELFRGSEFFGERTNNQAEYLALRSALRETFAQCGDADLLLRMDSQLMAEQLKGNYRVKNEGLRHLYDEVIRILGQFKSFQVEHIPREQNKIADQMANEAMDRKN
jgi:ribonuclease HI